MDRRLPLQTRGMGTYHEATHASVAAILSENNRAKSVGTCDFTLRKCLVGSSSATLDWRDPCPSVVCCQLKGCERFSLSLEQTSMLTNSE